MQAVIVLLWEGWCPTYDRRVSGMEGHVRLDVGGSQARDNERPAASVFSIFSGRNGPVVVYFRCV